MVFPMPDLYPSFSRSLPAGLIIKRLKELFKVRRIPQLVIIDGAGNVSTTEGVGLIGDYKVDSYPFTPERVIELKEQEEAARRNQTINSLLVSSTRDYVISKDEKKLPVSELVGKNILLYFSAHWCPPCRAFTPKLIETYHEIKAKENAFEVIFVSSDRDQKLFDEYYSSMPWLALPFGDERKSSLNQKFKIQGIPSLVALGPSGRTVTASARSLVVQYGADAFPFTDDHIARLKDANRMF